MTRQHPEDEREDDRNWARAMAYVQRQLSDAERREFEAAVARDVGLRALEREAEAVHRRLSKVMPATDWTEQEIEDRILHAWEQEQRAAPAASSAPRGKAPASGWWWWAGAAAAAALAAGVVLSRGPGRPEFPAPVFQQTGFRGEEPGGAGLTAATVERLDRELTGALIEALSKESKRRRLEFRTWSLHREYHALAGTSFRLEIALKRAGREAAVQTWSQLYEDEARFRAGVGDLAGRVAGNVAVWVARPSER